jgi:hypothetical protein
MGAWQAMLQKVMREYNVSAQQAREMLVKIAYEKALHGGTGKEVPHGKSKTRERSAVQGFEQEGG